MFEDQTIEIKKSVIETMKEQARSARPSETCALLLGNDNKIDEYYSMRNVNQGIEELLEIDGINEDVLNNIRERVSLSGAGETVNINEAEVSELEGLEGIKRDIAEEIVERRQRIGKYENPEIHFKFDPGEFARAQSYAREQSRDVMGVYHSHPAHDSEAYPSEEDQEVGLPGFIYFILNFQPDETIINAFEFVDGEVCELEHEVVDGE